MICRHCNTDLARDDIPAHLVDEHHARICVLCARRGRATEVESGHCCAVCRVRIDDWLRDIIVIGDSTAVDTRASSPGASGTGMESKPPTDLDRLAPYLALVNLTAGTGLTPHRVPVAHVLLDWERIVREDLHLAWIGDATAGHVGNSEAILAAQSARASVALLRGHIDWITSTPSFPLDDFADQIEAAFRRMTAFAADMRSADRIIECPTITDEVDDEGAYVACGHRLSVRTWRPVDAHEQTGRPDLTIGEPVICPRCKAVRSPEQLIHAAGKDTAWADAEAIADWYGIGERTLRRWASKGHVRRDHGRYNVGDVVERMGSVSA